MKINNYIRIYMIVFLFGCQGNAGDEKAVDGLAVDDVVEYKQEANNKKISYVEVEKFNIRKDNKLHFAGKIVSPLSADKLDVSIEGVLFDIEDGYLKAFDNSVIRGDENNSIFIAFKYNIDGSIQGLIITNRNIKDPFSGQWSFVVSRGV